ncbi:flavin reductase family protein [Tistrella bauzanensis]
MARRLVTERWAFALHYFVRGPDHVAFRTVLERADLRAHVHLHQGCGAEETVQRLDTILGAVPGPVKGVGGGGVWLCGPRPFMAAARQLAQGRLAPGRLHAEDFAAPAAPAPEDGERTFEVVLARSGLTVRVPPGVTIARALAGAGIAVLMSCEQGICGTCLTRVLAGRPDHRDQYLLDDEKAAGDRMTLCVSRSLDARLVLDL